MARDSRQPVVSPVEDITARSDRQEGGAPDFPHEPRTFLREYQLAKEGQLDFHAAAGRYKIALMPGLCYQSKPHTKGDLREVRATLEEAGFEVVSIPILEAGSVEQNAKIIADFIKNESVAQKKIALVSTSMGGPDTIYALGHL